MKVQRAESSQLPKSKLNLIQRFVITERPNHDVKIAELFKLLNNVEYLMLDVELLLTPKMLWEILPKWRYNWEPEQNKSTKYPIIFNNPEKFNPQTDINSLLNLSDWLKSSNIVNWRFVLELKGMLWSSNDLQRIDKSKWNSEKETSLMKWPFI